VLARLLSFFRNGNGGHPADFTLVLGSCDIGDKIRTLPTFSNLANFSLPDNKKLTSLY
jgi:hypothetical protein